MNASVLKVWTVGEDCTSRVFDIPTDTRIDIISNED